MVFDGTLANVAQREGPLFWNTYYIAPFSHDDFMQVFN